MTEQQSADVTRRVVLRGVTMAGVALPILSACGSDGGGEADAPAESASAAPEATSEAPAGGGGGGSALATTADVPVGGGTVLKDEKVVITQPAEGEFKAFTAVCTHKQCLVAEVKDGTITCPCHGSMYSAEDGSVTGGPAPAPLAEVPITVEGDQIMMG